MTKVNGNKKKLIDIGFLGPVETVLVFLDLDNWFLE